MENITEKAEQQILGFNTRDQGFTFIELIEGMGLTEKEFLEIQEESPGTLTPEQNEELKEYFSS